MSVVVRRMQRNVNEGFSLSQDRDVLPRWTPAKQTARWAPSRVMMLLVCALLMMGIYRNSGDSGDSATTQVEGMVLDPAVARALRTERETSPPGQIIQTATHNRGAERPSSPMPTAPQETQPGHVAVEWADRPAGVGIEQPGGTEPAHAPDDEGSQQSPPGPSATPAAAPPLDEPEEQAFDEKTIAEAKVASKARIAAAAAKAKAAAQASKARASAARRAEQAERDGQAAAVWRAAAGAKHLGSAQGRATGGSGKRADRSCTDRHTSCAHWASVGECQKNRPYMGAICSESCGWCIKRAEDGKPSAPPNVLGELPPEGQPGGTLGAEPSDAGEPFADGFLEATSADFVCADQHPRCLQWSKAKECMRNPGFMHTECPWSCGTCRKAEIITQRKTRLASTGLTYVPGQTTYVPGQTLPQGLGQG
jgi:hypothetical protein|mmetsp:Transcript_41620/g.94047  ORF Transcript_41620/g.94047 Transcript_41620/m.94047 type:complete len:423 (-) Transcript_41620:281-1549(-)